jgi:hypothetical protein
MKTITIFGSSLPDPASPVYQEAIRLGQSLAEKGWAVCNGGYTGLMEASARGAREAGGHTVGVTCVVWPAPANPWIVEEVRAASFLERLLTLIERGDGFVVLPGGTGTLAELALVWEMMNKSSLSKSVGGKKPLLVMTPYWQPVLDCLAQEATLGRAEAARMEASRRTLETVTRVSSVREAVGILEQTLGPR